MSARRTTAEDSLQAGIEAFVEERRVRDYYNEGLHSMFSVRRRVRPCGCTRCRAVVSADLLEQHWVVHEQGVDGIGAPGSTRWCPRYVVTISSFGMTGLKANGRRWDG